MSGNDIIFEQIRSSGCLSYVLGCAVEKLCVVVDPEIDKTDDYAGLIDFFGAKLVYVLDTHTHADHNSACKLMRERYGVRVIMHRATDAPYVDIRVVDGEEIRFGKQALKVIYTPGHTRDSMCLLFHDRIFTGDTLLIGGCGRTDLPGGDPRQLYRSLTERLAKVPDDAILYPGHLYSRDPSAAMGATRQNNMVFKPKSEAEWLRMFGSG